MANKERGDIAVTLGGRKFALRPTYEALCEIEEATGVKIVPLAAMFAAKHFGMRDMTAVVTAGLKAAGEPATAGTVGPMIVATGVTDPDLNTAVNDFFVMALSGGKESGEGDAEKETAKSLSASSSDSPSRS